MLTNAMFCGFPLGAALGGFLAAWMIPAFGWRSVLLLGGVAPILLTLLIVLLLPESVRYLIAKGRARERIRAILARIDPHAAGQVSLVAPRVDDVPRSGIAVVFSSRYLLGSLMLWTAYFMGLAIFYGLINWLPLLLRESGMAPQRATLVSSLFPLGGVGAVCAGWLMDRFEGNRIVAIMYALTALSLYALGQAAGNVGLLILVVFLAGVTMNTAQSSLPALAAAFYPTEGRATGVAWMMGIGRFGGIFGSFLIAELSRRELSFATIFAVLAVPGLLAAVALALKLAAERTRASQTATRASRPEPAP
jgi:AAHS family 4-hydroxybenzoate transporter-like MFS transporter